MERNCICFSREEKVRRREINLRGQPVMEPPLQHRADLGIVSLSLTQRSKPDLDPLLGMWSILISAEADAISHPTPGPTLSISSFLLETALLEYRSP